MPTYTIFAGVNGAGKTSILKGKRINYVLCRLGAKQIKNNIY